MMAAVLFSAIFKLSRSTSFVFWKERNWSCSMKISSLLTPSITVRL